MLIIACLPTNEEKARREQFVLDSITDVKAAQTLRQQHIQDSVKQIQLKAAAVEDSIKKATRINDSLSALPKAKSKKSKSKRR